MDVQDINSPAIMWRLGKSTARLAMTFQLQENVQATSMRYHRSFVELVSLFLNFSSFVFAYM